MDYLDLSLNRARSKIGYTSSMKNLKLGTNFSIFIIFFGVAALDALQTQNWLRVAFWVGIGAYFFWADKKKS